MAWFQREKSSKKPAARKTGPGMEGLWIKCDGCGEIQLRRDFEKNLDVCPSCDHHHPIGARKRIELVADAGTFVEEDASLEPRDPLGFTDQKKYRDRLKAATRAAGEPDAFVSGRARLLGRPVSLGAFHFAFMGGSMGAVVGEKVTRVFERALERQEPAILFHASGGARMQEGLFSLMQMAKTSAAIARFRAARRPYVSVMLDPTTGGVAASFAWLGDVTLAEPKALIGFAGPRVIEQAVRQKLPEGFQRSEFLAEHGMLDAVVHRRDLRDRLAQIVGLL